MGGSERVDPDTGEEALTDLDLILLATVVAQPEDQSSALIGKKGTRRTRVVRGHRRVTSSGIDDARGYGIGDVVPGDATIVSIDKGKVVLQRRGHTELLLLGDPRDETSSGSNQAAPKSAAGAADDGIEKLADDRYAIDQQVIDKLTASPGQLSRLGRVMPHSRGGKLDGYRLAALRHNSLGRKLGLHNGDVVNSINGHELTSMQAALESYTALQEARELYVQITRHNKDKVMHYEIR